jgi:hypothetical protein
VNIAKEGDLPSHIKNALYMYKQYYGLLQCYQHYIILYYCFTLQYIYVDNFNQSLQNSALLMPQYTYVYCDLVYCCMF